MGALFITKASTETLKVTESNVIISSKIGKSEMRIPIDNISHITFKNAGLLGSGKFHIHHTNDGVIKIGVRASNVIRFNRYQEASLYSAKSLIELYKDKNYNKDEAERIILEGKNFQEEWDQKLKRDWKITEILSLCALIIGMITAYNINSSNDTDYTPTYSNDSLDSTPNYSNYPSRNTSPYTREELEADPTAPSKDPKDYDSNGQYVPHDRPSDNPEDYNMYGEYRPIENMTKEEIEAEAVEMMKKNGVGR